MMNLFLKWVIGGETGKRESALLVFLLWLAATFWIGYQDYAAIQQIIQDRTLASVELSLTATVQMWSVATPFVFVWMGAAFGFQWASQQTTIGGPRLMSADYLRESIQQHPQTWDAVHQVYAEREDFDPRRVG